MPVPCPDTIPFYYTTTLHIISTASVPVNLVGLYLVWYQSPGMQKYKYCLIYMQMASFLTEVHMSWICPGYYFFPMVGGFNTGEFFGQFISSHLSMSIWLGVFCFELCAGLLCFVYRHYAAAMIQQDYSGKMYIEKAAIVSTHMLPFFTTLGVYFSQLTFDQKYTYLKEKFPQCIFWLQSPAFEVYDYTLNPWLAITGIVGFGWVWVIGWYCFYLGVHTMIILQRLRHHMSTATYNMHKQALISLVMQMVIPGVFILIPLNICLTTVITGTEALQELATDTMFLIGSHSMLQCTVMILTNPRYRRVVREKTMAILNQFGAYSSGVMPIPCPDTIPFYYTTTLHIISTASVPVNLVGLYLVWYQSPGMQKYKYCLIYMQMASFLTEVHMSWICPGYYFFPMVGGYNTGEFFGQFISSHVSMSIWVGVFCCELSAGLLCFVYRHNAAAMIQQDYSGNMYIEKTALVLTHMLPFFTTICLYFSQLTYEQKFNYLKEKFPQCTFWLQFPGFEVYDYKLNPWLAVTGLGAFAWVFIIAWYCFFLGVHTMIILQRLRHHMSTATYNMHKQALLSLVMQLVVPGVLIIIPLDLCMFVVITQNTDLQEIATDSMFLVGSHSMCQCTVMILTNPRYRRVVREKTMAILKLDFMTALQFPGSSVEPSERTGSFIRRYNQQT